MTMIQEYKKRQSNGAPQAAMTETRCTLRQLLQMVKLPLTNLQNQRVDEKTKQVLEMHKEKLQRVL
jgi:hypothetical protein